MKIITLQDLLVKKKKRDLIPASKMISLDDVFHVKKKRPQILRNREYLYSVLPDGSWKGKGCFIVGGGPSLTNFDFSVLEDELTIGINRAYERFDPSIIFSMDSRIWIWVEKGFFGEGAKEKFNNCEGFKVFLNSNCVLIPEDIYILSHHGLESEPLSLRMEDGLFNGGNSGFAALNLAMCLGANPIYLLGFDMKGDGERQEWWHDGYPELQNSDVYKEFKKTFEKRKSEIIKLGFRVVNLNPDSELRCFEVGKTEDVLIKKHSKDNVIFVAFYTINTGYEQEIKKLIAGLERFNLPHEIEGIDNRYHWQRNVKYKAEIIKKALKKYPDKAIVYLDSDSIIHHFPSLFFEIKEDIACNFRNEREGEYLNGAVLFFNNTPKAHKVVDEWIRRNYAGNIERMDQEILYEILRERRDVAVYPLPLEYCKIFDIDAGKVKNPIIEQFQASRRFKKEVCKFMEIEWMEKDKYDRAWECKAETASVNSKRIIPYVLALNKKWKMLEFGCGTGYAVRELKKQGFDIIGQDITLNGIEGGKEGFVESFLWKLPFKDNEFDFTYSTDVMEHIPPEMVEKAILEIYRVTRLKTFHAIAPFPHINQGFNFHLSVHPIKWWQEQFKRLNIKQIETDIIHRSFLNNAIGLSQLQEYLTDKKIAIIGNAESVLEKEHPEIDSHDIVVRFNNGIPRGKEKYIGSRTDILSLCIPVIDNVSNLSPGIIEKFNPRYIIWLNIEGRNPLTSVNRKIFLYPYRMELLNILEIAPSSGCMVLDLLVRKCGCNPKNIFLYGFDFFKSKTWYHIERNYYPSHPHSAEKEKEYIYNLLKL